MTLKLLSYNVHKFFNLQRTNYFLAQLKEQLAKLDLDFVFLQEFRGEHPSKFAQDFDNNPLEHLADDLWDYRIYGKNAIYNSGHHGNAILSKYPFNEWKNFDISNHRLERRSLLMGQVNVNDIQPLSLCCTHLDLTSIGRQRQINKIGEILSNNLKQDRPLLLCGDFNDWNGKVSKKLETLNLRASTPLPTYPSFMPLLSLDKIVQTNMTFKNVKVLKDSFWKDFSDHLPLYAELEL